MKKIILPIILVCVVVSPVTTQADVSVELAGMKIVWKSLKKEFDGFRTYNSQKGAHVMLAVCGGNKQIIGFEKNKSKVTIFDGSGDLGGKFGIWNEASKDGKVMRIEVSTEKLPAASASTLTLSGSLELVVASKTETQTTEAKALKKGDKIKMSEGFSFEIASIGKPKWGNDPLEVILKWKRKVPELAAVRFYDKSGKLIKSSKEGSSSIGIAGKYTVTRSYKLKKKSNFLKIEMDLWIDAEKVTVPIKMDVGIGGVKP